MTDWKPGITAPRDGGPVLLWARLSAHPFEPGSYFAVVGYYHDASGIERWKSCETHQDLEVQSWASIPKPPEDWQ
jgi:hypothetical protein